jgi:hypothetical protein
LANIGHFLDGACCLLAVLNRQGKCPSLAGQAPAPREKYWLILANGETSTISLAGGEMLVGHEKYSFGETEQENRCLWGGLRVHLRQN